ncbi:MAG: TlpA family protein disulfide reductase [Candidatus Cryptobacteroides sp.]
MKTKAIIIAFSAGLVMASCGQKASDITRISGEFAADAPEEVTVSVPGKDEIRIAVVDGKFAADIPADIAALSLLAADNGLKQRFISDGTPLVFSIDSLGKATVTSKTPKLSVQMKNQEYKEAQSALADKYRALFVNASEEQQDSLYNEFDAAYRAVNEEYFNANKDNFISSAALANMQFDYTPAQLDSLISTLDSAVISNDIVTRIKKGLEAQMATAEGKMFTDFEVDDCKLSSYVGTGKYMLVDFWASWCGPCKAEIPNVKNVWEKYAGKDFDVLSVAVWDEKQASLDTAAAYGVKWNQIVNAQSAPTDIYGIQGIPHLILFGPDGTILKRDLRGEDIEAEVAKYVQPKN